MVEAKIDNSNSNMSLHLHMEDYRNNLSDSVNSPTRRSHSHTLSSRYNKNDGVERTRNPSIEAARREILQSLDRSPLKLYPNEHKSQEKNYFKENQIDDDETNFSKYDFRNLSYRDRGVKSDARKGNGGEGLDVKQQSDSILGPELRDDIKSSLGDRLPRSQGKGGYEVEGGQDYEHERQQVLDRPFEYQYERTYEVPRHENQREGERERESERNGRYENSHEPQLELNHKSEIELNHQPIVQTQRQPQSEFKFPSNSNIASLESRLTQKPYANSKSNTTIHAIPTPKKLIQSSLSRSKSQIIRERPSPNKVTDSDIEPALKKRSVSDDKTKRLSMLPADRNRRQSVLPKPGTAPGDITIRGRVGRLLPPSSVKTKPIGKDTRNTTVTSNVGTTTSSKLKEKKDNELSIVKLEDTISSNQFPNQLRIDMEKKLAAQRTEVLSLKAKLSGKDNEIKSLKSSLEQSELKVESESRQREELIAKIAKELHSEYNKKHESKIVQFKNSVKIKEDKLTSEIQMLKAEIEHLNMQLVVEREKMVDTSEVEMLRQELHEVNRELRNERVEKAEFVSLYETYRNEVDTRERERMREMREMRENEVWVDMR